MPAKRIGVNDLLATACQKCGSACCKKGQIFLPREEYDRIRTHLLVHGSMEIEEFDARTTDHGLFFLYDQKNGCQFLDERNLCRLHNKGIKPSECFWWPYHIYTGDDPEELELRVFLDCCDAHEIDEADSSHHQAIEEHASRIGFDVIRKFRETYCGGDGTTRFIRSLTPITAKS